LQFEADMSHDLQLALPYKWNQDLTSVSVTVPLPSGTRAKNLIVDIKKMKLKVSEASKVMGRY
jgi:hypothetical protein